MKAKQIFQPDFPVTSVELNLDGYFLISGSTVQIVHASSVKTSLSSSFILFLTADFQG